MAARDLVILWWSELEDEEEAVAVQVASEPELVERLMSVVVVVVELKLML